MASSSRLDLIEFMPTPKRIKTASTSLPSSSSSSSASPPNLSMASSSSLDPYKDLPIQEIITTASTSLPSSSSSRSLINSKDSTSLPSSSRSLINSKDLPPPKRIKTASTSLPSSSSSSASPPNLKWTYDVFLSFRGEDTRNNFVGHLFMNLTQKGINTFRDDEKLERGKEISGDLLKAIEESRLAIIIFSENYASSSWCLDELVKIIDCTKETGQIAYPVFYNVDPSNVRNQKESFAKAFDEHKKKKNLALGKMEKWREALSQAGNLSGWDTRGRSEAKIIQEIVEGIFYKLSRGLLHVGDNLVGMEIRMEEINTRLNLGSNDVRFVGIHGLGGIGKTTTAKVIYNQISYQFQGCCYLANIRERCDMERNLVSLQKQLLYDILKVQEQIFDDDSGSSVIEKMLKNKKVLIILDDVDHVNQLEKFAGNGKWFGSGSIIIITTRDQHLLNKYEGVQRYEVKECDRDKSLEIFSWKAFKQNYPPEDYMELSNEVVHYTKGLPLALTVLGSYLCGRSKDEWKGAIKELKIIPNEDVTKILEISYKGLKPIQKEVFLDIACFFIGEDKDKVMEKLESFGFCPSINIPVLIDKSLITVSAKNELMMHDLVRDMGRYIVHEESPKNFGKRSRLWNEEDIRRVLDRNTATEAIEGIQPNVYMCGWSFKAEAFMEMKNLRFLESFFYPCEHLALYFPHDKLVHLSLRGSDIKSLWNGRKADLPHLKSIDLFHSRYLREFPDVTGLPNLEQLSLWGCKELVEIHPSVWVHKGLKFLNLDRCHNLVGSFPNKIEMESLETLDLGHCYKMKEFPEVHGNMKRLSKLVLSFTKIKELPSSIENFTHLKILRLCFCMNLVCLPSSNCKLSSALELLDLGGCSALERLDLGGCSALEHLDLDGCSALERLGLGGCSALEQLDLGGCSALERLGLGGCSALEQLDLDGRSALEKLDLGECSALEQLGLYGCSALERLDLGGCSALEELHLYSCSALEQLGLYGCSALVELDASRTAIKEVPASIQFLDKLRILSFNCCRGLKLPSFYGLPSSLTELYLSDCDLTDETFPSNIECLSSLQTLYLSGNNFESLPSNIGDVESLVKLDASRTAIKEVPASIQFLDKLKILSFRECRGLKLPSLYGLPSSLTDLDLSCCNLIDETSLETLDLSGNNFVSLATNIFQFLDKLRILSFRECRGLKLPSFYGLPSSLTDLDLSRCDLTDETFPSNIECLSSLQTLDLSGNNFESLPSSIGDVESLVKLDASRTAIKEVPASIQFLDKLRILSLRECRGLKLPSFYGLPSSLTDLDLRDCDLTDETFPSNIECLSSLETLGLSGNNFECLSTNITQLSLLTRLDLSFCKRIKSIPELPNLIT